PEASRPEPARQAVAPEKQLVVSGPRLELFLLQRRLDVPLHGPNGLCRVVHALRAFGHGSTFGTGASYPSRCNCASGGRLRPPPRQYLVPSVLLRRTRRFQSASDRDGSPSKCRRATPPRSRRRSAPRPLLPRRRRGRRS